MLKTLTTLMFVAVSVLAARLDPSPGRAKCSGISDSRDWPNPYIIVAAAGVTVIFGSREQREMPVGQLASFLKSLPKSAWRCGRVAAVQPAGVIGIHDQAPVAENFQRVKRVLKQLGIRVDPWPPA